VKPPVLRFGQQPPGPISNPCLPINVTCLHYRHLSFCSRCLLLLRTIVTGLLPESNFYLFHTHSSLPRCLENFGSSVRHRCIIFGFGLMPSYFSVLQSFLPLLLCQQLGDVRCLISMQRCSFMKGISLNVYFNYEMQFVPTLRKTRCSDT
jgi:hypothetical protein